MTADEVDDFTGLWVFEEAVDGEVTALGVFFRGGEGDGFWATSVFVGAIGAGGGDFDVVAVVADDGDAEVRADFVGVGEKLEDFRGSGGGGDVEVLGFEVEDLIADAASGEIRDEAGFAKLAGEISGGLAGGQDDRLRIWEPRNTRNPRILNRDFWEWEEGRPVP